MEDNTNDGVTNFPIRVTPGTTDENGNVSVNIEYGEGFREWFMQREGLKRWSEKRFQKVMTPLIVEYYSGLASAKQEGNPDGEAPPSGE